MSGPAVRAVALLLGAGAALAACAGRAGPADQADADPRALTAFQLGGTRAWDDAIGDDSLFRPRIVRITSSSIGILLTRPAHVAVIQRDRCGPYASVPGRELSRLAPAGVTVFSLSRGWARSRCGASQWPPLVAVVAAELPLHGDVLAERARDARSVEDIMAPRRDRWAMYVVYPVRL